MSNPAPYASPSLYVGDLSKDITEGLLFEMFNAVGPVASVRICRDAATRRSLGYAYVNFHRMEDAERALDSLNYKTIRDRPCRIMWSHRDPSLRKSGVGNIFIKGLAKDIENKALYDTFSMFGNILSCKVATDDQGNSLGYGFVHFEDDKSAQNAITKADGKIINGGKININVFKPKKDRGGDKQTYTNIFVKNLPSGFTQAQLEKLFSKYGEITKCHVSEDTDRKTRFAFVNYKESEDAKKAVEAMNNEDVDDQKISVCAHQKKRDRERELRARWEQKRLDRQSKYQGVNLYVKNLADNVTDATLSTLFEKYGSITSAKVMLDESKKTKGFGFVCFQSQEEATKACTEMNGFMHEGKPLYVALAQRKETRRVQLAAQWAARAQGYGAPMYPPQAAPFIFQGMPMRGYPTQMMPRYPPQSGAPGAPGMMVPQPMNYQLMPMVPGGRQGGGPQRGRGRGGRGGGGRGGQQPQRVPQYDQRGPPGRGVPPQGVVAQAVPGAHNMQRAQVRQGPAPQPVVVPQASAGAGAPLSIQALAAAPENQKKEMIGERLYPLVRAQQPELAGKITGMLLEMDNGELVLLLESKEALSEKISEAVEVLNREEDEEDDEEGATN